MGGLAEIMSSLPLNRLKEISNAILHGCLIAENGGDHRPYFRKLREVSTGRTKKIYSAIAKTDRAGINRMARAYLSVEWPK